MTPAINLLVPERFDVAAKTLYAWFRDPAYLATLRLGLMSLLGNVGSELSN